jgi:hypothetical protein
LFSQDSEIFAFHRQNTPTQDRENPGRLWKIRQIFYVLYSEFSELYHPTELMAVGEVIMKFKWKVIFQHTSPKKHEVFGIKNINFVRDPVTHAT